MRYLWCVLFPPRAVALVCQRRRQVLFSILLTLCLWLPGVVHAWGLMTDFDRYRNWETIRRDWHRARLVNVLRAYAEQQR